MTTTRSLLQPMAPDLADIEPVTLTVGAEADFDAVIARLVDLAYTRVDMVGKRGEFAVRGGILDVFPDRRASDAHRVLGRRGLRDADVRRRRSALDPGNRGRHTHRRPVPGGAADRRRPRPRRQVGGRTSGGDNTIAGSVPDMLAKLSEGIPVDGMEALLPLLRPTDLSTLTAHLPENTPC